MTPHRLGRRSQARGTPYGPRLLRRAKPVLKRLFTLLAQEAACYAPEGPPRFPAHAGGQGRIPTRFALSIVATFVLVSAAHAAVLCTRPRFDGTFNANLKIREACKRSETQVNPADVGLQGPPGPPGADGICPCTTSTETSTTGTTETTGTTTTETTTTTTSTTTTTIGVPCGSAEYPTCAGDCPAGQDCVGVSAAFDTGGVVTNCKCAAPSAPCMLIGGVCPGFWCPPGSGTVCTYGAGQVCVGCQAP
jgi:hypothetical protein